MKNYVVLKTLRIISGVLKLTGSQAEVRKHNLNPVPGNEGFYQVINPVEFKNGERIAYDGDLGRSADLFVSDLDAAPVQPQNSDNPTLKSAGKKRGPKPKNKKTESESPEEDEELEEGEGHIVDGDLHEDQQSPEDGEQTPPVN